MKINRLTLRVSAIILIFFTVVTSCSKDDKSSGYSYFVSKELSVSFTREYITSLIDFVSGEIPELNNIKPLVISDINIYKLVYKTTINGHQIDASGLVCVPATPGDYPVLSFQNGTNTVNAYAPSESASDNSYKLIEIIASMGYVVVIADYPGFGEAIQVPHPYLVADPTVQSLVDMLFAVKELTGSEMEEISLKNEYYLIGYSQGGWATMALHKALEINYPGEFNLIGSVCGAGPYDIKYLFQSMINDSSYPMPVYLGYIVHAYSAYNQFTNPANEILNEPYASRLGYLYNGLNDFNHINSQLTTSITGLITADFLSGFNTSPKYSTVREALTRNSVTPWHTLKPLYLLHGGSDTQVNPAVTTFFYNAMIAAGTSAGICNIEIIPGLDHGDGVAPCMIKGLQFILNLADSR